MNKRHKEMVTVVSFAGTVVLLLVMLNVLNNYENQQIMENYNPYGKETLKPATIDLLDEEDYRFIIQPNDLKEKIASGETVVAFFFSPKCVYCTYVMPILMPVAEQYEITVHQYNLLEYPEGFQEYELELTATLIAFKNGEKYMELISDFETDTEELKQFFEQL